MILEVIVIFACLLINAFFCAIEMAFVTVSKPQIKRLMKSGDKTASKLLDLRNNPERALSILQLGIALVNIISAAVGGAGAQENIAPWIEQTYGWSEQTSEILAIILVVLPITYLNVTVSELAPKNLALRHPLKIALFGAPILIWLDRLLYPVVSVLESSTNFILTLNKRFHKPITPATDHNIDLENLSDQHKQYVVNLVNIEHKLVKDIILPWPNVNKVSLSQGMDEVNQIILASGHTRLPVCDNEKPMGLLHSKEFIAFQATGSQDWQTIIRPIISVLDTTPLLNALRLMQMKRSHMSLVFSRDGVLKGIVTLEDIIEEIVGDIFDEDDDGTLRRILGIPAKIKSMTPR